MESSLNILVTKEAFNPDRTLAEFRAANTQAGAIATFLGQVRPKTQEGSVNSLILHHYSGFTEDAIEAIAVDANKRWPLLAIHIVHRVGKIEPGEPIVFVAVAADHRREAFEAVDFLMDYLKSEAPFWKQEVTSGGVAWIEPRAQDHADKARWKK